ncbi:hypothetical protein, partial [Streptomyces sp. URMC 124]|uniref:hypothetical protein n=1 Tax=Streptomyces sp. URMC 124 TaxID=3423405 RepID=UPI003F1C7AB2
WGGPGPYRRIGALLPYRAQAVPLSSRPTTRGSRKFSSSVSATTPSCTSSVITSTPRARPRRHRQEERAERRPPPSGEDCNAVTVAPLLTPPGPPEHTIRSNTGSWNPWPSPVGSRLEEVREPQLRPVAPGG